MAQLGIRSGAQEIRAIVQYDYEAGEDNELHLTEGQIITDIEMIDEGPLISDFYSVS